MESKRLHKAIMFASELKAQLKKKKTTTNLLPSWSIHEVMGLQISKRTLKWASTQIHKDQLQKRHSLFSSPFKQSFIFALGTRKQQGFVFGFPKVFHKLLVGFELLFDQRWKQWLGFGTTSWTPFHTVNALSPHISWHSVSTSITTSIFSWLPLCALWRLVEPMK